MPGIDELDTPDSWILDAQPGAGAGASSAQALQPQDAQRAGELTDILESFVVAGGV